MSIDVLIVEDNPETILEIRGWLQRCTPAPVMDAVSSGQAAIEKIRTKPYDMVICDQRLPGGMAGTRVLDVAERHGMLTHLISSRPELLLSERARRATAKADLRRVVQEWIDEASHRHGPPRDGNDDGMGGRAARRRRGTRSGGTLLLSALRLFHVSGAR